MRFEKNKCEVRMRVCFRARKYFFGLGSKELEWGISCLKSGRERRQGGHEDPNERYLEIAGEAFESMLADEGIAL